MCLEGERDRLDVQGAWVYLLLNWVWSKAGSTSAGLGLGRMHLAGCVLLNDSMALTRCDTLGDL